MLRSIAAFSLVLFFAATAYAFVVPADFLARSLAEKRRGLKIFDMSIQLHTELAGQTEPIEERLYLKFPERLRRAEEADDGALYVEREGRWATGTEKKLSLGKGPIADLTALFFQAAGSDEGEAAKRMLAGMRAIGVDTSVVALGRFQSRNVYIIGARVWEPEKAQVWLDKATFLPVRFIALFNEDGATVQIETRLLEYGSAVAGNWFPKIIETYRNGKLVRRAEVLKLKTNQKLPETLFDLPK